MAGASEYEGEELDELLEQLRDEVNWRELLSPEPHDLELLGAARRCLRRHIVAAEQDVLPAKEPAPTEEA